MLLSAHKDLKLAILSLPAKEKDKLLLRLIAKDKILTEHLHFKLLEDAVDLQDRHEALKLEIEETAQLLSEYRKPLAKDVLLSLRKLNGKINHHYKVTKELSSEVELRLFLLNEIPLPAREGLYSTSNVFAEKLITYFLRTTKSMFAKYNKLHEDLQFDMNDHLNQLLKKIDQRKLSSMAAELGLPDEV
jgi:hypothetical protein